MGQTCSCFHGAADEGVLVRSSSSGIWNAEGSESKALRPSGGLPFDSVEFCANEAKICLALDKDAEADNEETEAQEDTSCEGSAAGKSLFEEAEEACQKCLQAGDAFEAERILLEIIARLEASDHDKDKKGAKIDALRASKAYVTTLQLLEKFEDILQTGGLGDGEGAWKLGAEVNVDYQALGMQLDAAAAEAFKNFDSIKFHYRVKGKRLDIKTTTAIPTDTPSGVPGLAGFVAMWLENDLWRTWNPVVVPNGVVELVPRGLHHNTMQLLFKLFFVKQVVMQEVHMAFDYERGAHVFLMEGLERPHRLWKRHPCPKDWGIFPGVVTLRSAAYPRTSVTTLEITGTFEAPLAIPECLIKWGMQWFVPESARRMLRAGTQCCTSGGPHFLAISADKVGAYADCQRLVARGKQMDAHRGKRPAERTNGLLHFEAGQHTQCTLKHVESPDSSTTRVVKSPGCSCSATVAGKLRL